MDVRHNFAADHPRRPARAHLASQRHDTARPSIGDDVHLRHCTTFGVVRRNENKEVPTIEECVDIGCGVCILGDVRVGHHSVIGANSVVLHDMPPYSVIAGAPARAVRSLRPQELAQRPAFRHPC
jgi:serine acetyltransferase